LARSLKKAATVLVLGALILAHGVSQVAAAASNGVLTTAFVTDDLCVAGPYKNSTTAPLSVSFGANTAGDWESIFLFFWRESDQWGYSQRTVAPPTGSTWASSAGDFSVNENALLGTSVYYYLYGSFGDAGDGWSDDHPPLSPPNIPSGGYGAYHQTSVDMSQDPDCIPRPEVQLEYNGAVSSGPATALNGRDFGDVPTLAGPQTHSFTLRSVGISSVDISAITITGAADFTVSPASLGPISATETFTVSFDPSASGVATAQLNIVSDAVSGTLSVPLTGNGQVAATALALAASQASSTAGEPVSFTATLSGATAPTGNVEFFDGATSLGSAPLSGTEATLSVATLGIGAHTITATYSGDTNNAPSTSAPVAHAVGQIATTLVLAASGPTSEPGQEVTFTATLTPASASGTVTFLIDGAAQPPSALSGGVATLATNLLEAGEHAIIARYDGDTNYAGSVTPALTHAVVAPGGSIVLRQETDGTDAVFGFSSPTIALNLSIPTSGGRGESAAVSLAAGTYSVTADDMSGAGFGLTGLTCSDSNSTTDVVNRTARIVLDAGEALVCTFTAVQSRDKTAHIIENFLTTRAGLILANQPDIQRRIDRLNGVVSSGGNPVSSLMSYLPGMIGGSPLNVSTSLGAIDRLAGNEATSSFDIWLEGTFALFDAGGPNGNFSAASFGADYLITPDLLIGGFVQLDHLSQSSALDAATISGAGWLAGPYVTALVGDNLYVDIIAGAGTSQNQVSPYGTYEDSFGATRWLLSASLQGQWQWDNWTFSPRARVSYFEETTKAYIDGLGVGIPSITAGVGQIAMGPAISYRYTTEGNVIVDTGLRLEGIAEILNTSAASGLDNLHGRIEGTIDLSLPGGAKLGLSAALDGIGGNTGNTTSAKVRVSLPIN
jgi:hypothetical protein